MVEGKNLLHLTSYILHLNVVPGFEACGHIALRRCVVPGRLELPTSTLSVWRSNQLSYRTLSRRSEGGASAQPRRFSHIRIHKNSVVKKLGKKSARPSGRLSVPLH